jgi:Icc-related predicted phosphoesterase
MKCIFVSDFHTHSIETPPGDLLIVAGDMTMRGADSELQWFKKWLEIQPQRHKVWVAGNHDRGLERDPARAEAIAKETATIYLNDSFTEVGGLRIWGSPITPRFYNWAFMRDRGPAIREHWEQIPEGLDILITHGPPYGCLDQTPLGEHVGCEELYDVIANKLKRPPRYHVFGHIHDGYGRNRLELGDGRVVEQINAAICDEHYQAVHPVIALDIPLVGAPPV